MKYCQLAVKNCYLLGMPEYERENEKILREYK